MLNFKLANYLFTLIIMHIIMNACKKNKKHKILEVLKYLFLFFCYYKKNCTLMPTSKKIVGLFFKCAIYIPENIYLNKIIYI